MLQTEVKSKVSALKKRLQKEPAFPNGSPGGRSNMGAWKTSHPGGRPPSEIRAHRHGQRRVTSRGGKSVICPKASWSGVERAWRESRPDDLPGWERPVPAAATS